MRASRASRNFLTFVQWLRCDMRVAANKKLRIPFHDFRFACHWPNDSKHFNSTDFTGAAVSQNSLREISEPPKDIRIVRR
jgi:hypothetical protein